MFGSAAGRSSLANHELCDFKRRKSDDHLHFCCDASVVSDRWPAVGFGMTSSVAQAGSVLRRNRADCQSPVSFQIPIVDRFGRGPRFGSLPNSHQPRSQKARDLGQPLLCKADAPPGGAHERGGGTTVTAPNLFRRLGCCMRSVPSVYSGRIWLKKEGRGHLCRVQRLR